MADNAIIDSHAHLDYPQLADDLPAVLARANAAGVSHVITIGVKLSKSDTPKKIEFIIMKDSAAELVIASKVAFIDSEES